MVLLPLAMQGLFAVFAVENKSSKRSVAAHDWPNEVFTAGNDI